MWYCCSWHFTKQCSGSQFSALIPLKSFGIEGSSLQTILDQAETSQSDATHHLLYSLSRAMLKQVQLLKHLNASPYCYYWVQHYIILTKILDPNKLYQFTTEIEATASNSLLIKRHFSPIYYIWNIK